ncbi:unnamed protein product [Lupinus luteus]|uniref:Uncharacterized protein n=1 Tax=Lupinus luteus TaxID=3873 RepID=A0AAV1XQ83_LUPLU
MNHYDSHESLTYYLTLYFEIIYYNQKKETSTTMVNKENMKVMDKVMVSLYTLNHVFTFGWSQVNLLHMMTLTLMTSKRKKMKMFRCGDNDYNKATSEEVEREQMSTENVSQYSLTAIVLPSLGATAAHAGRHKLRRYIISPYNPRYK